jgi:hypothetical protein
MAWDHALKMHPSQNIYLFMVNFSVKYATGAGGNKSDHGKGSPSQSARQNIAEATPLVRNKKEEFKKPITPIHCE